MEYLSTFFSSLTIGGMSAVLTRLMIHPLQYVSAVVRNQDELIKVGRLEERYSGFFDCARRLIRENGFTSLWKGSFPSIADFAIFQALHFAFYGVAVKFLVSPGRRSSVEILTQHMTAGGIAGGLYWV